jgi:hypothetical protein
MTLELDFSVSDDDQDQTIAKYLRYIKLRLESEIEITEHERSNTYQYYSQFCKDGDLPRNTERFFYRALAQRGIVTDRVWSKDMKRLKRLKDFDIDTLNEALANWVDNSAKHVSLIEIGKEKYQITIKLTKLLTARPLADGEEK